MSKYIQNSSYKAYIFLKLPLLGYSIQNLWLEKEIPNLEHLYERSFLLNPWSVETQVENLNNLLLE